MEQHQREKIEQLERLVERLKREHGERLQELHREIRRLQDLCADVNVSRVLGDEILQLEYDRKCKEVVLLKQEISDFRRNAATTNIVVGVDNEINHHDDDLIYSRIEQHLPPSSSSIKHTKDIAIKRSIVLPAPSTPLAVGDGGGVNGNHQQTKPPRHWLASIIARRSGSNGIINDQHRGQKPAVIKLASQQDCSNKLKLPPIG